MRALLGACLLLTCMNTVAMARPEVRCGVTDVKPADCTPRYNRLPLECTRT
jgi:hypothetical protein